ncbi:hypothetical protein [Chromobacterium alticapitis]|nr:hypothetical protein [Chromobacterium alticapitis]
MSIAPIATVGPQALTLGYIRHSHAAAPSQTAQAIPASVQDKVSISSAGSAKQQEEAAESAAQAAKENESGEG